MYHPVLENDYEDQHEFVELYNRADFAFDVGGWKLGGEVMFTIPAGTLIPARGFLVIAKNRTALLSVASYGLNPGATLGDYTGQLDNAGGLLVLLNAAGGVVDSVGYDDRFPWPIAADALGASDNWLPPALLPLDRPSVPGRLPGAGQL